MNSTLIVFLGEFFVFLCIHLFLHTKKARTIFLNTKAYQQFLVFLGLLQFISIAIIPFEAGDVKLFSGAGWHLRHGIDFYFIDQDHGQYPFFPFLIFLHAGLNWLTELFPFFTFSFYLKIILLTGLWSLSFMIKRILATSNLKNFHSIQLQFLTSPIIYSTVLFHGQTDVLVVAFFFGAMILLSKQLNWKKLVGASLLYACSIATKTWSALLLPLVVNQQKSFWRSVVLISIIGAFLLSDVFIYTRLVSGSRIINVLPAVLKAGGPTGIWGISLLFSILPTNIPRYTLFSFGVLFIIVLICILKKNYSFWFSCFLTILTIYVLIPNWGVQYLFWIVPFLYVSPQILHKKSAQLFLIFSSIYIFLAYVQVVIGQVGYLPTLVTFTGFIVWGFCVWWLIKSFTEVTLSRDTSRGFL